MNDTLADSGPTVDGIARERIKGMARLCDERRGALEERMDKLEEHTTEIAKSVLQIRKSVYMILGGVTVISLLIRFLDFAALLK